MKIGIFTVLFGKLGLEETHSQNVNRYGLTDMQFRTVGYGHDMKVWADMISELRFAGYDGAISIEHEDGLMSKQEGFAKAVHNLKPIVMKESIGDMWWV